MTIVKDYMDLDVYLLALELQQEIYELSKLFPNEERYSLTDQIRRCSRSIGANISEAWAKRRYKAHFISKLSDSDGEQLETLHWLKTAFECGYIIKEKYHVLTNKCHEIGQKLGRMMKDADKWCARF